LQLGVAAELVAAPRSGERRLSTGTTGWLVRTESARDMCSTSATYSEEIAEPVWLAAGNGWQTG